MYVFSLILAVLAIIIAGVALYIARNSSSIPGPQGIEGPAGPQGIQGINGAQGPQGFQGPKGEIGLQGYQGVQGPQGIQGINGPQGPQGPAGKIEGEGIVKMSGEEIVEALSKLATISLPNTSISCKDFFDVSPK